MVAWLAWKRICVSSNGADWWFRPALAWACFCYRKGKLNGTPVIEKPLTLGELFSVYREKLPQGAQEINTRYTVTIHRAHFRRLLGEKTAVMSVNSEAPARSTVEITVTQTAR